MKTKHLILRSLGKLLAVWMIIVLGMANGWAVMLSPTSAQLAVTPSPAMAGQTVTLRMSVTGSNPAAPPTGVVTFKEGLNVVLGSIPLTNGVATLDTRFSTTGIHGVTATYAGDGNNGGTSMTTWFNITAATTTTQLASSINPAQPGQTVSLSAMVSGVNPTGTVTFRNGNTFLGTALLTAGTTSITQACSTVGNYTLTASYSGDTNNLASTSSSLTLAVSIEPQVYYIHTDHLDTPRTITDTNGTVVWQWDNTDPFGANAPNENPGGAGQFAFNLRFAGQYYDRETGLNYNVYRDYDPRIGRYIQSDPVGVSGGINTYTFVEGSPVSFIDPSGLAYVETNIANGTTMFNPVPYNIPPLTITTRVDVTSNSLPGANGPYTTPSINWISQGTKSLAYGPDGAYIDTGDPRGRDIHGGGSCAADPYADQQGWCKTLGCTRGQNEDVKRLGKAIDDFKKKYPGSRLPYIRK